MAIENLGTVVTFPANADLSSSQYCFVSLNSSGNVAVTGDGAHATGVLQNDPAAAARAASVALNGVTKVKAGGTVTAGGLVASDSTGRAVDVVSGDYILGEALEAATAANQIISIVLNSAGAKY